MGYHQACEAVELKGLGGGRVRKRTLSGQEKHTKEATQKASDVRANTSRRGWVERIKNEYNKSI